jgi:6-phospho-beta-glucosidase
MSYNGLKVAVIGGGSSYTPELVEGFIKHYKQFPVKELFLVDIEPGKEKLEIVGALSKRMVDKSGIPMTIHLTLNRREAIRDADFVCTQIRVGQLDARAKDERIPARYGLIGQETTGAGGFAKALRTIPVILDICKDIRELAPQAFLLNFTNPAGIVTEAVLKYGGVKTIGLCNLPIGTQMQIAKAYDVTIDKVYIEMQGINHLNWTTRILVDSKDVMEAFLNNASEVKGLSMKNIPDLGWDQGFLRSLGALPCAYHRYYYMKSKMLESQQEEFENNGSTRADVVKQIEKELFELYKDPDLHIKPPQLEKRGGAYYSEVAVNLMMSIFNDRKDIQVVNVRNNGIISCLPDDASVEVNAVICAEGAFPIQPRTSISPQIRGLLQAVKAYEELAVEAAVHGNRDIALQALTIHPLVGCMDKAAALLEDILREHKDDLPQFKLR